MGIVLDPWPQDCVGRGAHLMDCKLPGWREKINLRHLNMADGCRCVASQAYKATLKFSDYYWSSHGDAIYFLSGYYFPSDDWEVLHGFLIPKLKPSKEHQAWVALRRAWIEEIAGKAS